MKKLIFALLLLTAVNLPAQVIKPSSCDYRFETSQVGNLSITNWYFDLFYGTMTTGIPPGTYFRQISETGVWRDSGAEPIVVVDIPGAFATFTEGIDILPTPPPIHFFRLRRSQDTSPQPAVASQMDIVMKDQPTSRGGFLWLQKQKKLKKAVTINIPPHGRLVYHPKK